MSKIVAAASYNCTILQVMPKVLQMFLMLKSTELIYTTWKYQHSGVIGT